MHNYEVRPRKDDRSADLISDALPFGRLWCGEPNAASNALDYAKFRSRSHDAVIRVYDDAGDVIETNTRAISRVVSLSSRHVGPFNKNDVITLATLGRSL
jgi:hypothetical protein